MGSPANHTEGRRHACRFGLCPITGTHSAGRQAHVASGAATDVDTYMTAFTNGAPFQGKKKRTGKLFSLCSLHLKLRCHTVSAVKLLKPGVKQAGSLGCPGRATRGSAMGTARCHQQLSPSEETGLRSDVHLKNYPLES